MPIRPLVDRVLDGHLDDILRRYVAQGLSPSRMALRLAAEHQVEVSGPTLKKWVSALPPREAVGARRAQAAQGARTAQLAPTAQAALATRTVEPPVAVAL